MRSKHVITLGAAVLLGALATTTPAPAQTAAPPDVQAQIAAVNNQLMAALKRGDAAAMAALYSRDAKIYPSHSDVLTGRQVIEQFWRGSMRDGIRGGKLTATEVEMFGNMAWETGEYTMTGKEDKIFDRGKYLVIWKKEQGQWRLYRDIWNTNMAPVSQMNPYEEYEK